MRNLDFNEYKLCQMLGSLFEKSVDLSHLSSLLFIRRFMNSSDTECFFDKSYLVVSWSQESVIETIDEQYRPSKNKTTLPKDVMYWVGYIYGALSFLYKLTGKAVYRYFSAKEIVSYYNAYHTYGIEQAAERMMENIGYDNGDMTSRGVKILRRLLEEEKKNSSASH